MKKIVIIGATGYVGSAILKEALGRGHQVKAIVRDPSKLTLIHPHLKVVGGSVTDTDFLSRELAKSDAVISAFNPGWSNPNIYEETPTNCLLRQPSGNDAHRSCERHKG